MDAYEALAAALLWWETEGTYETWCDGDGEEYNVFDEDPQWVLDARKVIANKPVPVPDVEPTKILLKTQLVHLTQADVDILDGSINRTVRTDADEDAAVKQLYRIWETL